jgi:phosphate transport system substrate-binding protein
MRRAGRALAAVVFLVIFGAAAFAVAQEPPAVRVTIATSGRAVFDGLLDAMTTRAGLTGRVAIRYADAFHALRDLCRNDPGSGADVVLTTHRMQAALAAECTKNGIDNAAVVELARSALILAVRTGSELTSLTSHEVYLAIAREVPYKDGFTRNTAVRWADVDNALPPQDIRFQLPMRDEGSRATFDTLVLQGGCRNEPVVKQVYDAPQRTARCVTVRSDRVRELPRAQAVKALLEAPVGTVGVLSQREMSQAGGQLVGLLLDGIAPTPEAIRRASYDFSGSFWLYARRGNPDVEHMIEQAQSEAVIGPDGPLPALGVAPLPADEREAQRAALAYEDAYGFGALMGWLAATGADAWQMLLAPRQPMPAGMAMDFTSLMDIAGYRITSVASSIGIIPDAGMTFGVAREMSDADHIYLEHILYRDALARPGAIAAVQRRIIRSILGVREVGGFEVSKVDINFLPLPKVALTVTPIGGSGGGRQTTVNPSDSE